MPCSRCPTSLLRWYLYDATGINLENVPLIPARKSRLFLHSQLNLRAQHSTLSSGRSLQSDDTHLQSDRLTGSPSVHAFDRVTSPLPSELPPKSITDQARCDVTLTKSTEPGIKLCGDLKQDFARQRIDQRHMPDFNTRSLSHRLDFSRYGSQISASGNIKPQPSPTTSSQDDRHSFRTKKLVLGENLGGDHTKSENPLRKPRSASFGVGNSKGSSNPKRVLENSGREISRREPWQVQKSALTEKFKGQGWKPRKRLSPDALEGIRALHAQYPETYTTPVLADQFKISPEAIRRILKSKWRPNEEEEEDRRKRWDNRGEGIWSQMVELGIKPPKKWREMGVGKSLTPQQVRRKPAPSAKFHKSMGMGMENQPDQPLTSIRKGADIEDMFLSNKII